MSKIISYQWIVYHKRYLKLNIAFIVSGKHEGKLLSMSGKISCAWIRACENASLCSALMPSTKREATKERKPLISVHYVPMLGWAISEDAK